MNAVHENVVRQFRAGQAIAAIAEAIGYTPRAVRRILQKKDVRVPRFPGYVRREPRENAPQFASRPDGEYCRCKSCDELGYGVDAWHPATIEFWATDHGRLSFARCRACISEQKAHVHGVVPGRIAA